MENLYKCACPCEDKGGCIPCDAGRHDLHKVPAGVTPSGAAERGEMMDDPNKDAYGEDEPVLSESDLAELDRLQITHPNLWQWIRSHK